MNKRSFVPTILLSLGLLYSAGCAATKPNIDPRWSKPEWICLEQILSAEGIDSISEKTLSADSTFSAMHADLENRFVAFLDNWQAHGKPSVPDNEIARDLYSLTEASFKKENLEGYQVIQSDLSFFVLSDERFHTYLETRKSGLQDEFVLKGFRPKTPFDKVLYLSSGEYSDEIGNYYRRLLFFLNSQDHLPSAPIGSTSSIAQMPKEEQEARRMVAEKYLPISSSFFDRNSLFLEPQQRVSAVVLNQSRTQAIVTYDSENIRRSRSLWEKQPDGSWKCQKTVRN